MASCSGCDTRWTSTLLAHCSVCHRSFYTVEYFDDHRNDGNCIVKRRCYEEDGIYADSIGHANRRALAARMEKARAARYRS